MIANFGSGPECGSDRAQRTGLSALKNPESLICQGFQSLKRVARIELATKAWEAFVLPLNYTRSFSQLYVTMGKYAHPIDPKFLFERSILFAQTGNNGSIRSPSALWNV